MIPSPLMVVLLLVLFMAELEGFRLDRSMVHLLLH